MCACLCVCFGLVFLGLLLADFVAFPAFYPALRWFICRVLVNHHGDDHCYYDYCYSTMTTTAATANANANATVTATLLLMPMLLALLLVALLLRLLLLLPPRLRLRLHSLLPLQLQSSGELLRTAAKYYYKRLLKSISDAD